MSKNTSSEIKLTPTAPAALPALKGLNLQVFVMIAAIVVIMLFFTWVTDGAYLSARNISNLLPRLRGSWQSAWCSSLSQRKSISLSVP